MVLCRTQFGLRLIFASVQRLNDRLEKCAQTRSLSRAAIINRSGAPVSSRFLPAIDRHYADIAAIDRGDFSKQ